MSVKRVVIIGATSGIGLEVAKGYLKAGWQVGIAGRREEELEKLVQEVIATFGRLDIVVSNAGMNVFEGAAECSESRWAYNLDLNLASHWRLARIAKPYLEQSGNGVILLMTSNHAFCSIPGCFPYNVTKTVSKKMFLIG